HQSHRGPYTAGLGEGVIFLFHAVHAKAVEAGIILCVLAKSPGDTSEGVTCTSRLRFVFPKCFSTMLYATQANITVGQQSQGLLSRVLISLLTTVPSFVFLFINGTMLFTLRSRRVFRETSRYILLYNLLFADTVQLAQAQLLYLLAVSRILLMYSACVVLTLLTDLTNDISPLTLVVMSLERYIAVCYPLRHTTVVTVRNTGVAVTVVWAFSSLNILIRVLLLLDFISANLQMNDLMYYLCYQWRRSPLL
uniref:olfactory receptor-like protein OLF4 n=1 Tax=Monopterus albus TaxID=43700 RepID=UPI0009B49B22